MDGGKRLTIKVMDIVNVFFVFFLGTIFSTNLINSDQNLSSEITWIPMFLGGTFGIIYLGYCFAWRKESVQEKKE